MARLGSLDGYGHLVLDLGNEIGVHYQIDVFQTEDGGRLAGGSLTGDALSLSRTPERSKAVLELSSGHRVDVIIVETSGGTARIDIRGELPDF